MKKLKLFFACLLMAVLSIGQVWAAPAAVGTTLFSENFGGYSNTNVPSGSVSTVSGKRVVYGDGSVTYTSADGTGTKAGTTKVTTENNGNLAGGTSPELMVGKKGTSTGATGGSFSIAGIPSGGAQEITVSYKQNAQNLSVSISGTGYSTTFTGGKPSAAGERTFDIAVADGADATFTLTFQAAATSNVRVDDILVTVKTAGEGATPTCATPTFDPEDGETFTDNIEVEIASATDGATIYYTTDGEDPTTSSDVYTTALNFTETTTLKAMAVKEGSNNSAVATATYTKVVPFAGSILEITKDDFVASYASNNGDHEKDGVTYYTNQVCLSSSSIQFQKSNGLLYNKTDLGEIAKIEITKTGDNNLLVYSGTTENPTTGEVTGSASGSVTTYTFASGKGFFAIKCNSTALSQVTPIKIYYVYSAPAVVAPTISGETPFSTSTTVSITHADADAIYYTTDGSDPKTSGTKQTYSVPFTVNADGTTTVKAYAVKGSDESAVASKEFEKVTSYSSLADIFTKATEVGNTATDIYVTFGGWKVSAKTSNNVFLTDGTNGAVIYGSGHGFNAGDVLTGTVACKVQLYKGFTELTSLNSATPGLTVTPGSVGDPVVKTWGQLSAVNTGALVKLENLTYDGSSLSDGVNTIPTYTTFYTASFEDGKSYNLTGVYQYYDTDGQILPRSAADVDEIIETFTVTYNNAPENGTLTIKNGDDVVTSGSALNEGTVLTIVTTPAEGYKLVGVTVNGSAYAESTLTLTEDVTIAASFELNQAPLVTSYVLSEIGVETSHLNGEHVGDKVNLPLTATECSKTFRGWTTKADFADGDESLDSYYAAGAEYTLVLDNKLYAVYATPDDNAANELFTTTSLGSTNTVTDGYAVSAVAGPQSGYYQDGGSLGNKRYVQVMVSNTETQIIPAQPSTITVTATLGGGSTNESLTNPVYAVLLNASGEEIGDPVVMTSAIEVAAGKEYSQNLPVANYADVRGVRIYHVRENKGTQGYNVRYFAISLSYTTESYSDYSTDCDPVLVSVAISGDASVLEYNDGDEFDPTGLVVTGHYSDNSDAEITEGITWAFDPATLSVGTTSVSITATVGELTSDAVVVNGLTVTGSTPDPLPAAEAMVIVVEYNSKFYAMSTTPKNTTGFEPIAVTKENGKVIVTSDEDAAAIQWQIALGAEAATFQNGESKYLACSTESNTGLALLDDASEWAWDADANCYKQQGKDEKDRTFYYNYNTGNPIFRAYLLTTIGGEGYSGAPEFIDADKIEVQVPTLKIDPELAFDPSEVELTLGEDFTAPTLNHVDGFNGTITYSSSKPAVATVDENTGVVTIVANGTTTITASFAGNDDYEEDEATYTITVNKPAPTPTSTVYRKVTVTADITDGEYLIVYEGDATHDAAVFDGSLDNENIDVAKKVLAVEIENDEIAGNTELDAAVFTIDVTAGSLQSASGLYIGRTNYDNGMDKSTETVYTNTFAISEGNAVITGAGNCTLRYNYASDQLRFRYYKSGQQAIQLYKKEAPKYSVTYAANGGSGDAPAAVEYEEGETFTVAAANLFTAPEGKEFDKWNDGSNDYAPGDTYTVGTANVVLTAIWKDAAPTPDYGSYERNGLTIGNYGTICLPNGGTISGATLFDLDYYDGANTLYLLEVNGNAMVAGRPYIFLPSATSIEVTYTDNANALAGSFNGLVGSYIEDHVTIGTGVEANYILYQNAYYLVDGPARVGANRAYIHMAGVPTEPSTPQVGQAPRRRVGMTVHGEQTATGFENINASEKPMKLMIDGNIYILRGEKVYDATGRMVK